MNQQERKSPARRVVEAEIARGGMTRAAKRAAKKRLKGVGRKGRTR